MFVSRFSTSRQTLTWVPDSFFSRWGWSTHPHTDLFAVFPLCSLYCDCLCFCSALLLLTANCFHLQPPQRPNLHPEGWNRSCKYLQIIYRLAPWVDWRFLSFPSSCRFSSTGTPPCSPPSSTSCAPRSCTPAPPMYTCSCMRPSSTASHRWVRHMTLVKPAHPWCCCACRCANGTSRCLTVRKLQLCDELDRSSCGNVLFNGYLPPPGTAQHSSSDLFLLMHLFTDAPYDLTLWPCPSLPSKAAEPPQRGRLAVHGRKSCSHGEGARQAQQHHAAQPGEFWDTRQS